MSTEVSRPKNFGIVLFPGFQALDAFGPLDVLNTLSHSHPIELSILAASLDPVSTETGIALAKSKCAQSVLPTHTFDNPPSDLEAVLIPGGYGVIDEKGAAPVVAFVKSIYPSLKYLITVCNGATVAACAGVLDGKRATSNKALWKEVTAPGPNVKWVPHARWVVDGNIYTSSGVSAGIDAVLAFVDDVYGEETAKNVANMLEYRRHTDSGDDPFAELYGL